MGFLTGTKFLITGISSNRSIAYGIAKACAREGAELALSYNNERFKERVQGFADEFGAGQVIKLDASSDESIDLAALELANRWTDGFDGFVHSIGWAPRESISGSFLEGASREGFLSAMNVSVYSYIAMAKRMVPLMAGHKASLLTLSYLGGEKVVPNYNTMGLCKAALESATRYIAADVARRAFAPTHSPAARLRLLPQAALKALAQCWLSAKPFLRLVLWFQLMKSATPQPSFFPTILLESLRKPSISTAALMLLPAASIRQHLKTPNH